MNQKLIAGLLVTRSMHPKDVSTRGPTQVTCQIFKELPRRIGRRKGREKYASWRLPSTKPSSATNPPRENRAATGSRARIIGVAAALSTDCHNLFRGASNVVLPQISLRLVDPDLGKSPRSNLQDVAASCR